MNHEEIKGKPHVSYSQINTYLSCPLKYRFHYIDTLDPSFTPAALCFGSCIHESVNAFHQSQLEGDPLRPDQLLDVFRQCWITNAGERPVKFFNGESEEGLASKARRMLEVFHAAFDPDLQAIIGIEEPFEVSLGKRIPPLVGWIDSVEASPSGMISIVDLKTAARKYSEQTVHSYLQLSCYAVGAQELGFNGNVRFRLDVLTKTQNPELIRYETTRTDDDCARFLKLTKSVWQGIRKGVFYPKQDWHCTQCGYADVCRDW
jgi:putative RecB family exonuclease